MSARGSEGNLSARFAKLAQQKRQRKPGVKAVESEKRDTAKSKPKAAPVGVQNKIIQKGKEQNRRQGTGVGAQKNISNRSVRGQNKGFVQGQNKGFVQGKNSNNQQVAKNAKKQGESQPQKPKTAEEMNMELDEYMQKNMSKEAKAARKLDADMDSYWQS